MSMVFCRGCGKEIHESAISCPLCGAVQREDVEKAKNKTTAALLAFFFGAFGVHKFYLGQAGRGILYILFCWTFIPTLISIIEAIIFISMTNSKFDKKYNV